MISERKLSANRKNAQLSTGPRDTTKTRFNAQKHGILSKELLITTGDGREDPEELEQLRRDLWDCWQPVEFMEEYLVDELVSQIWRKHRIYRYESGVTQRQIDWAVSEWEERVRWDRKVWSFFSSEGLWQSIEQLAAEVERIRQLLAALGADDPLAAHPELWRQAFTVAEERCKVRVRELLGLKAPWANVGRYSKGQIQRVIEAACRQKNLTLEAFWHLIAAKVQKDHQRASARLEHRTKAVSQVVKLNSIPDDRTSAQLQRHEAHVSRELYRAEHELLRLQAARLGQGLAAPIAVDVDMTSDRGEADTVIEAADIECNPAQVTTNQPALPGPQTGIPGDHNRDLQGEEMSAQKDGPAEPRSGSADPNGKGDKPRTTGTPLRSFFDTPEEFDQFLQHLEAWESLKAQGLQADHPGDPSPDFGGEKVIGQKNPPPKPSAGTADPDGEGGKLPTGRSPSRPYRSEAGQKTEVIEAAVSKSHPAPVTVPAEENAVIEATSDHSQPNAATNLEKENIIEGMPGEPRPS